MFMLLDERKLNIIPYGNIYTTDRNSRSSKKWMAILKYFDIFTQRLYFVDWVYLIRDKTTVKDIARYLEIKILKSNVFYFDKCKKYLYEINKFKSPQKAISTEENARNKFKFYEEYDTLNGTIHSIAYNKVIDDEYYWGDIFIFQLNPDYQYFQNEKIPLVIKTTFKSGGIYLYADKFMFALAQKSNENQDI